MKKSNVFARVLSCTLAIAALCSVSAFAAETYDSQLCSHGSGEQMYDYYSSLYSSAGPKWRAATWVQAQNEKTVPAGYLKAKAFLYDAAGNLCKSTVMQTNTTAANYLVVVAPGLTGTGEYYNRGEVSLYLNSEYRAVTASTPADGETNVMKTLKTSLDKDGGYPVDALGQTYGSDSIAGAVGYSPELIDVMATNGTGYAKKAEFYFASQHAQHDPASRVISVYDLDGKVVGEFKFEVGQSSNDPAFAGLSIDEAREKLAAGQGADRLR